jgi:hypothetical protein
MEELLLSIQKSIEAANWYAALCLALIIPDICGKLENKHGIQKRYEEWYETYLNDYHGMLTASDCYSLRCAYLHEGTDDISSQRAREVLDKFIFVSKGPHLNRLTNNYFGDSVYDGKDILQLSVTQFCTDIMVGAKKWLENVESNASVKSNIEKMIKIEASFSIGNAIKFVE